MRRLVLLALVVAAAVTVRADAPIPVRPTDWIVFDYDVVDWNADGIMGFQVQWDGGMWTPSGLMGARVLPDTGYGAWSYRVLPPFNGGTHTLIVRACNAEGCGDPSAPIKVRFEK